MPLPWAHVNETAPSEVAEILELAYSPRGGRKRLCPFCGGQNFSPLKRAFFCYSGCGGVAYSNIDTAAAHWRTTPADACRRLAREMGETVADSDPPWKDVAGAPSPDVARVLGLEKADGQWLWNCPSCGGAGTLRSYKTKWRCGNGPCAQDERQGWRGHVDLAMIVWATAPVEACFRLATELRLVTIPRPVAQPVREPRAVEPSPRESALAAIHIRPGARHASALYKLILQHLRLGALGRGEFARRRIDAAAAEAYGFRSVEPGEWESRIVPFLAAFTDDELTAAGFPPKHPGRPHSARRVWWPGYGRAPLLVIPFWDGDRLAAIRFRNLGDPEQTRCSRYVSPVDVPPEVPFHAAAASSGTHTLFVIEGELNAYVAVVDPYQRSAIGLPGAHVWLDDWSTRIADSTRYVVGCFDNDRAGWLGAIRTRDSLARVRGFEWAYHRWRACFLDLDKSDLHIAGDLARFYRSARWVTQDVPSLWADSIELAPSTRDRKRR